MNPPSQDKYLFFAAPATGPACIRGRTGWVREEANSISGSGPDLARSRLADMTLSSFAASRSFSLPMASFALTRSEREIN